MFFLAREAVLFSETYLDSTPYIALYVHIAAWICQFVGHGFIEKRSPAIFDSFVQAVVVAPLFVFLEFLFWLGYRPALQSRIREKVQAAKAKWISDH